MLKENNGLVEIKSEDFVDPHSVPHLTPSAHEEQLATTVQGPRSRKGFTGLCSRALSGGDKHGDKQWPLPPP